MFWPYVSGWLEGSRRRPLLVGLVFSASMPLSDTGIDCIKEAGLAIASATLTGPVTSSLAVDFSTSTKCLKQAGFQVFHTWTSSHPPFPLCQGCQLTEVILRVVSIENFDRLRTYSSANHWRHTWPNLG